MLAIEFYGVLIDDNRLNFDDISKVFIFYLGVALMAKSFFPEKINFNEKNQ